MKHDMRVSLCTYRRENPAKFVTAQGDVVRFDTDGALGQTKKLGPKYGCTIMDTSDFGLQHLAREMAKEVDAALG